LLLRAVLRPRVAAAPAVQQSIDISYLPGPEQQTRRTLLQLANGTDGRMDRWTHTVLYRFVDPGPYASSANNTSSPMTILSDFEGHLSYLTLRKLPCILKSQ